jgi:uncharacterized RDD family membrane protein YckC
MSWQTPGQDPPPDPATPEPDAETTRVPLQPAPATEPSSETPAAPDPGQEPPAPTDPTPPTAGLISAAPVGWAGSSQEPTPAPPGEGPAVSWAPPVQPVAASVTDGLVISGVFTRLVAYSIDILFLQLLNLVALGLLGAFGAGRDDTLTLIVAGLYVAVDFLYFVGLWTSGWHATLGMRLLRLRILGAANATTLSINDALLRWLALSGAVSILTLVPGAAVYVGLLGALWALALLITTATNPLHQGLHDRWARSVIVQPAPGGSGVAVVTCLVLVVVFVVILPLGLVTVFGDQVQEILLEIGRSV